MKRMPMLVVLVAALALSLSGCIFPGIGLLAGSDDTQTLSAPEPIEAEVTATPTPAPAAVAPSIPGPQLPAVDPAGFMTGQGGAGVEFDSPSHNITCGIYPDFDQWGCAISDYHYTEPEPTGDLIACSQNIHYGGGFNANMNGEVTVLCRGGATFGSEFGPVNVLPYGTSVSYSDIVCESYDHTGCRSLVTGHGFTLARGEYTVF